MLKRGGLIGVSVMVGVWSRSRRRTALCKASAEPGRRVSGFRSGAPPQRPAPDGAGRCVPQAATACRSGQLLVAHAMRLGRFVAEAALLVFLVLAVVAGEELDVRVAFEREDVRGDA